MITEAAMMVAVRGRVYYYMKRITVSFCHELAEACRKPIVTTSANITGSEPPYVFDDIERSVMEKAEIAIDEGITRHKYHSSVVDLVDKKIIRKGGEETVDLSEILNV